MSGVRTIATLPVGNTLDAIDLAVAAIRMLPNPPHEKRQALYYWAKNNSATLRVEHYQRLSPETRYGG